MMKTDDFSWTTELKGVKKQLQTAFMVLEQCCATLKAVDTDSRSHLQKVTNLAEQYHCSAEVNSALLPMSAEFPDLKRKLLYKIGEEISGEICHLKVQVMKLQDCSESLSKQFEKCMQCYRRSTTVDDLQSLTRKTPIYPSVSEMLQWLQSYEASLRESFLCKQYLLETYRPGDGVDDGGFERAWSAGDRQLVAQLEDCMAYTSHFMELNLT